MKVRLIVRILLPVWWEVETGGAEGEDEDEEVTHNICYKPLQGCLPGRAKFYAKLRPGTTKSAVITTY